MIVCAPVEAERLYDFSGVGGRHVPVPRSTEPAALAALRIACGEADLVHAHGLHAGLRAALALSGRPVPLVVTWHTRAHAEGARAAVVRLLERRVARAASVVLGTSSDLVDRARRRGARDARLAAVALPAHRAPVEHDDDPDRLRSKTRAELGATDRPLLMAVGSLDRHRDTTYCSTPRAPGAASNRLPWSSSRGRARCGPCSSGASRTSRCRYG